MTAGGLRAIAGRVGAEVAESARGVARILRGDPAWAECFDLSLEGFFRSFAAPTIGLPIYLFATLAAARGQGEANAAPMWVVALAYVFNALAYPLGLAALSRPLGFAGSVAGLVIVTNWGGLLFDAALATAAAPLLVAPHGVEAFGFLALLLLFGSIFFIWRAGRETLGGEIASTLLAVVLWVAVGALSNQLVVWLQLMAAHAPS